MPVTFSQFPASALASTVAIENNFVKKGKSPLGMRIALLGQYLSTKTPTNNIAVTGIASADDIAQLAGYGSQAHRMAIKLFGAMGSAPALVDWFPIADGTTAKAYTITFAGAAGSSGVWRTYIDGIRYEQAVASGDTAIASATALAALINADLNCPFTASSGGTAVVTITAKWKGLSSDSLDCRKNYVASDVNLVPSTQTMTIASSVSGATDPALTTALANFGNINYTIALIGLNDATAAAALGVMWTARIDPGIKKPCFGLMGYTDTRANFITALGSLNTPGACYFPVEGSPCYFGEIAAEVAGLVAKSANADPGRPFKNLVLPTILPGTSAAWTFAQADVVEKAGGSAFDLTADGKVKIWDLLTTYKTNSGGAADPSWQYVLTITNTQRKESDINTMLLSAPFDRAVIISDDDISSKDYALSPRKIKAFFFDLFDFWGANNWSTSIDTMKAGLNVEVNSQNPGRIDVEFTDYITVGLRIIAVKRNWALGAA